jgi:uncharacterized protein (DUF2236 family)
MELGSAFTRALLSPIGALVDSLVARLSAPEHLAFDFARPRGAPALVPPGSVSWRIFKNPVSVFVGGVAAVILELAEPAVRTGVWEHSSFRRDPVRRLQRTGRAAMITVYGPRAAAETLIAGVVRRHDQVTGAVPGGETYRANDPRLLDWVQATAVFGFTAAYERYVATLGDAGLSQAFAESAQAARLYGASGAPTSLGEWEGLLDAMHGRLEASPIVFAFLDIMRDAPALPRALRPLQDIMIRGAVEMTPSWVRARLGLLERHGLGTAEAAVLRHVARLADRIVLRSSPAVQSCIRLGLPADVLYGSESRLDRF